MNSSAPFRFDDKMNFDFHAPRRVRVELNSVLNEIEKSELVRRLTEQELAYLFKHALVQDSAYSTLMKQERRRLHDIVAQTLERMHVDHLDEYAAVLAQHYGEAGTNDKELEFATRAAEVESRVFARDEARAHYAQALNALSNLPDSISKRRHKIDLSLRFLDLRWTGGTPEQDLLTLLELEETAHELALESNNAIEDRLRLAQIHLSKGGLYFVMQQMPLAMQAFQQVLDEAQDLGDKQLLATPSVMIGGALVLQGFFRKALPLLTQAWDVFKEERESWQWICLVYLSTALANLGRVNQAHTLVRDALTKLDSFTDTTRPYAIDFSLGNIAWVERSVSAMLEYNKRAVEASRKGKDSLYLYIGLAMQALAESAVGQLDAARTHLEESKSLRKNMGTPIVLGDWADAFYAQTALNVGEVAQALVLAQAACQFAQSIHGWYALGLAQRTWAQALQSLQPPERDEVDMHLGESLKAFETCEAPIEAARTRVAWGIFLRERGELERAHDHFEQAAAQFEASGVMGELEEARAFLDALPERKI